MSDKSDYPLRPYKQKIDSTKKEIDEAIRSLSEVIYPTVRKDLELSGRNYQRGLDELWSLLNQVVLRRASALRDELIRREKGDFELDFLITKHWSRQLNESYQLVERYRKDFVSSQVESNLPAELYLWLKDIAQSMKMKRNGESLPIIFQESNEYSNKTLDYMITFPFKDLYDIAKKPLIEGTLLQAPPVEKGEAIDKAHVILYISGEADKIDLWPAITHEVFHILQSEVNWEKSFKDYCLQRGIQNITLNSNQYLNDLWIEEILVDVMSISYFGPMFAFSLLKYLQRLPYPNNSTYPPMSFRLFMMQQRIETLRLNPARPGQKPNHPILSTCLTKFGQNVARFVDYNDKDLKTKKGQLDRLYEAITSWQESIEMKKFPDILDDYSSRRDELNPILDYDEIRRYIFERFIPLAVHPCILLNVVLAEFDSYSPDRHYELIVQSIRNWKIAESWRLLNIKE